MSIRLALTILPLLALLRGGPALADEPFAETTFKHDFGVVAPGTVVEHEFFIVNSSAKDVEVRGSSVTCGCLEIKTAPGRIRAGGKERVVLRMNTSGQSDRVMQAAYLKVGLPAAPVLTFELRGVVKRVWCEPEVLDFGRIVSTTKEPAVRTFRILSAGFDEVTVGQVESELGFLSIAPVSAARQGGGVTSDPTPAGPGDGLFRLLRTDATHLMREVRVAWKPEEVAQGSYRGSITLVTDSATRRVHEVLVTGIVTGSVQVSPSKLFFGTIAPDQVLKRTCLLTPEDWKTFEASDLRLISDNKSVTPEVMGKTEDGRGMRLAVTLHAPPADLPLMIRGSLEGRSQGGKIFFTLPYAAFVKPGKVEPPAAKP